MATWKPGSHNSGPVAQARDASQRRARAHCVYAWKKEYWDLQMGLQSLRIGKDSEAAVLLPPQAGISQGPGSNSGGP